MRKKDTISKIMKLKDNRKKEIEMKVRKAHGKAEEESVRLNALQNDYNDRLDSFRRAHNEGVCCASEVITNYEMLSHMDRKIEEQKKVNDECQNVLRALEETLVEAHKEKKAIEILDGKVAMKEKKERAREEQKELDYLGLARKIK